MKRYVVKTPMGVYEVGEFNGKATHAVLVRRSSSHKWRIHSFHPSEDVANEYMPTRNSREGDQVVVERWENKCVRPVEGWITGGKSA